MHLSEDLGGFAVLWLNKVGPTSKIRSAWAFFQTKEEGDVFLSVHGGELYTKHADGRLTRA